MAAMPHALMRRGESKRRHGGDCRERAWISPAVIGRGKGPLPAWNSICVVISTARPPTRSNLHCKARIRQREFPRKADAQ